MKIDIVISTRNRALYLRDILGSLDACNVPEGVEPEIVVVNNASTDKTETVVAEFAKRSRLPVRYLREERVGLSSARNLAIRTSDASHVAFLDDDALVDNGWVEGIVDAHQQVGFDVLQGQLSLQFEGEKPGWLTRRFWQPLGWNEYAEELCPYPEKLMGGNLVVRRDVSDRCGLFREDLGRGRLGLGEDTEFSDRISACGVKVYFSPRARAVHRVLPHRLSKRFLRRYLYEGGRLAAATEGPRYSRIRNVGYGLKSVIVGAVRLVVPCGGGGTFFERQCDLFYALGLFEGALTLPQKGADVE